MRACLRNWPKVNCVSAGSPRAVNESLTIQGEEQHSLRAGRWPAQHRHRQTAFEPAEPLVAAAALAGDNNLSETMMLNGSCCKAAQRKQCHTDHYREQFAHPDHPL